ncbi:MAG: recombination regulator RecX [Betaproteobacteria bacterium]|nr:recombination regulator RecX [Betaproteobacteria bacterium]
MTRSFPPARGEASLHERALRLLARREYSKRELNAKLAPHTESPERLAQCLAELEAQGLLSDRRFAEQLVHARREKYGAMHIMAELRDKGVEADLGALRAELLADERERAKAVWARKFGQTARDGKERARQIRFLQSRGFDFEVIRSIVGGDGE